MTTEDESGRAHRTDPGDPGDPTGPTDLDVAAAVRPAAPADAATVATLLHEFNAEYGTPTPGVGVLTARLQGLLAGPSTLAVLAGEPAVGLALVTLRPSVWYDGPVATLDELYVAPDRRGRGLGARLLAAVEQQVRRRGAALVEVNVDGDGGGAPRFYERHGYRNTEIDDDVPLLYYFRELES
ncbi:GNAT family N-acetyltransferase [Nakamurella sp.]|uniref:GNAT family N-acetyltransferase n=1 Tax=Nakamurella sp. TaxID=1869182 RepID=UPI003B3A5C15